MSFIKRRWGWVLSLLIIILLSFHFESNFDFNNEQNELIIPDEIDEETNTLIFTGEERYLGIKDGFVAIYSGNPREENLEKVTGIEVSALPEREKEYLQNGIVVKSQEELLIVLDGLNSSVKND